MMSHCGNPFYFLFLGHSGHTAIALGPIVILALGCAAFFHGRALVELVQPMWLRIALPVIPPAMWVALIFLWLRPIVRFVSPQVSLFCRLGIALLAGCLLLRSLLMFGAISGSTFYHNPTMHWLQLLNFAWVQLCFVVGITTRSRKFRRIFGFLLLAAALAVYNLRANYYHVCWQLGWALAEARGLALETGSRRLGEVGGIRLAKIRYPETNSGKTKGVYEFEVSSEFDKMLIAVSWVSTDPRMRARDADYQVSGQTFIVPGV